MACPLLCCSEVLPVLTRRDLLLSAGALPLTRAFAASAPAAHPENGGEAPLLPDTAAFLATDITYLDSGSFHPISLGARAAIESYLNRRQVNDILGERSVNSLRLAFWAILIEIVVGTDGDGLELLLRSDHVLQRGAKLVRKSAMGNDDDADHIAPLVGPPG